MHWIYFQNVGSGIMNAFSGAWFLLANNLVNTCFVLQWVNMKLNCIGIDSKFILIQSFEIQRF